MRFNFVVESLLECFPNAVIENPKNIDYEGFAVFCDLEIQGMTTIKCVILSNYEPSATAYILERGKHLTQLVAYRDVPNLISDTDYYKFVSLPRVIR